MGPFRSLGLWLCQRSLSSSIGMQGPSQKSSKLKRPERSTHDPSPLKAAILGWFSKSLQDFLTNNCSEILRNPSSARRIQDLGHFLSAFLFPFCSLAVLGEGGWLQLPSEGPIIHLDGWEAPWVIPEASARLLFRRSFTLSGFLFQRARFPPLQK